jgi:hypothetical protein
MDKKKTGAKVATKKTEKKQGSSKKVYVKGLMAFAEHYYALWW